MSSDLEEGEEEITTIGKPKQNEQLLFIERLLCVSVRSYVFLTIISMLKHANGLGVTSTSEKTK